MIVKKGNKVVQVTEHTKAQYLNLGFDILDNGKVVEYGRGASISPAEYLKVVEENEKLKAELDALKQKTTKKVEVEADVEAEAKTEAKTDTKTKKK